MRAGTRLPVTVSKDGSFCDVFFAPTAVALVAVPISCYLRYLGYPIYAVHTGSGGVSLVAQGCVDIAQ